MLKKRFKITKDQFSIKEDKKLLDIKTKYPDLSWEEISQLMKTKSDRQCRERYNNYLDPSLNKAPFTKEEDSLLMEKYNEFGSKWRKISQLFPNRSEVQVRNRCQKLLRNKEKKKKRDFSENIDEIKIDNQIFNEKKDDPDDDLIKKNNNSIRFIILSQSEIKKNE